MTPCLRGEWTLSSPAIPVVTLLPFYQSAVAPLIFHAFLPLHSDLTCPKLIIPLISVGPMCLSPSFLSFYLCRIIFLAMDFVCGVFFVLPLQFDPWHYMGTLLICEAERGSGPVICLWTMIFTGAYPTPLWVKQRELKSVIFLPSFSRPERTKSSLDRRARCLYAKYCSLTLTVKVVSGWVSREARYTFQYVFVSSFVVMTYPMTAVLGFQFHILYLFLACETERDDFWNQSTMYQSSASEALLSILT